MVTQVLGGNIVLTGFSDRDFSEMVIVKKIVGQYARKLSEANADFSRLSVALAETHGAFEIEAKVTVSEQETGAKATAHNIFVALDTALKQVSK